MPQWFKQPISFMAMLFIVMFTAVPEGSDGLLVLCQGEDGHVEIELAKDGRCGDCFVDDHHEETMVGDMESHCGSCVDTFLTLTEASTHKRDSRNYSVAQASPMPKPVGANHWHALACAPQQPQAPPCLNSASRQFSRTIRLIV